MVKVFFLGGNKEGKRIRRLGLKAIVAICTTRSSKGSGSNGSDVPKEVLVDGAKENQ